MGSGTLGISRGFKTNHDGNGNGNVARQKV